MRLAETLRLRFIALVAATIHPFNVPLPECLEVLRPAPTMLLTRCEIIPYHLRHTPPLAARLTSFSKVHNDGRREPESWFHAGVMGIVFDRHAVDRLTNVSGSRSRRQSPSLLHTRSQVLAQHRPNPTTRDQRLADRRLPRHLRRSMVHGAMRRLQSDAPRRRLEPDDPGGGLSLIHI